MTRKDYELIAAAIYRAEYVGAPNMETQPEAFLRGAEQQRREVAIKLANDLEAQNPSFKRETFFKAAGIKF